LVSQIDALAIRTERPERLFVFFTDVLGLPVVRPLAAYPTFTRGAVALGNMLLEVVRFGASERPETPVDRLLSATATSPRGFILSLPAAQGQSLADVERCLAERDIMHSPVLPFTGRFGSQPPPNSHWANILLGGLLGDSLRTRGLLFASRLARSGGG